MTSASLRVLSGVTFAGVLLADPRQTSVNVTIQLYNWAHVDLKVLTAAEDEASRIFREVGITWLNCALSPSEAEVSAICTEPCPWSRFALRIVYDAPADFEKISLGAALNDTGIYASVFYQRVNEFASAGICHALPNPWPCNGARVWSLAAGLKGPHQHWNHAWAMERAGSAQRFHGRAAFHS